MHTERAEEFVLLKAQQCHYGIITRHTMYAHVWPLVDHRRLTLTRVAVLIVEAGGATSTDVVRMRRRDYLNGAL